MSHPSKAKTIGTFFRIGEAIRREEYNMLIALGYDALDAYRLSWIPFQDFTKISVGGHPEIYRATEAKMITGKGCS